MIFLHFSCSLFLFSDIILIIQQRRAGHKPRPQAVKKPGLPFLAYIGQSRIRTNGSSFSIHSQVASFFRFIAANLSFTQFVIWAKPLYWGVSRMACFSLASAKTHSTVSFVQFPVLRRIADVVRQLLTAFPDMPLYGLYAVFGMGAQMAVGTVTNLGITFTAAVLAVLSCLSLRFLSHLIPFPNVPASPITPSSSFSLI